MKFTDLSYRVKIPLAISAVILLTELVVSTALVTRALGDARKDLEASARNLTTVLARSLRDPMVRDDLWQAFEVIRTPMAARAADNPLQDIVVLDGQGRVFVASDPQRLPVSSSAEALEEPLASLAVRPQRDGFEFLVVETGKGNEIGAAGPILADDGTRLGAVLLSFDSARYYHRVRSTLADLALISLPGMLLLIPLGWYWGKRMAEPLVDLARAIARVGHDSPATISADLPRESRDEIGTLAHRTRGMLESLARKEDLEREMIASERLAAVGRVSAAIAHEINNPLGGMLNAIDTVQRHGQPDGFTKKTLGLLERGLQQIRSTVSALLVEARLDSPRLTDQDWQDLRTLIEPQVAARRAVLSWQIEHSTPLPLPAHQVRQLVLNLLLNAVKATGEAGSVSLAVQHKESQLRITVGNSGPSIPPDVRARLFEPFISASGREGDRSYGLGLWVCYQITQQLRGTISVESASGWTSFTVSLPIERDSRTAALMAPKET